MSQQTVKMRFDPNTIEHLGVQLYHTMPPVIAELVANAYDADAKHVRISLEDRGEKKIIIEDDGHGMFLKDLELKFLKIGRNRRTEEGQYSESGKRKVIGKKGLGKLSFFGIARHVKIATRREGKENVFELDWDEIVGSDNEYEAPVHNPNAPCPTDTSGTTITLTSIKKKSAFDPDNLAVSLAKTFSVFNEEDFKVEIIHNGGAPIGVRNELKYENLKIEHEWKFPYSGIDSQYENAGEITGKIISVQRSAVLKAPMVGVALFSRGKLVNNHEFYELGASSHGYRYITGWLNVDFIDDWEEDVIGTNRQSLNWENEKTSALREYLKEAIKKIYNEDREKRKQNREQAITEKTGVNAEEWIIRLPSHERQLARGIIDPLIEDENIDEAKAADLIQFVQHAFEFEAFKKFAADLKTQDANSTQFLDLMKEWQLVEARELYRLAIGRITTIEELSKHIDNDAREVPTMHKFFKEFPWLLDPRIMEFKDEVTYSNLLKENYPEQELEEKNRRIDFVCTNMAGSRFIIELKRPGHKVTRRDIGQALEYRVFLEQKIGNESRQRVEAFVIGGSLSDDRLDKDRMDSESRAGKIYVRTYHELLENARKYHQEFIEKYEKLQNLSGN